MQVVAESPAPIATPVVGINIKHEEIEALATPRTLQGIATLSPALSEQSPNAGQLVINGGFAFDNIFMVNGVDVNDNLFANPQNLFIEDAIEETQVLTSGISAEYGRFGGGVVNAITKSGGNKFSGSGRVNFLNPSWSTETPFEERSNVNRPDINQQTYEGTFGGPISKDHLWFFTAGRYASVENPQTIQVSGVQVLQDDKNKRGELKLTGTVCQNHTIQGGYLNNCARSVEHLRPLQPGWRSGQPDHAQPAEQLLLHELPRRPRRRHAGRRAVFAAPLRVQGRRHRRDHQHPGIARSTHPPSTCIYNSPYFCACDPEQRNNRQLTAAVTNFWSAARHAPDQGRLRVLPQPANGRQLAVADELRVQHRFRSPTRPAQPMLDASGRYIPVFVPGDSSIDFYPATVGATLNIDNNSLYFQDHWAINGRWSADLGARYEHVKAVSTGDIPASGTTASCRASAPRRTSRATAATSST